MEESEVTTIVTSENAILRYMQGISEQNIPLIISPIGTDKPREYRSSILSVEVENSQLVLHNLMPADWQEFIQPTKDIEITCRMQHGTIKFLGLLSPLDDSTNSMYCRLTLPAQLSKKQLRAYYRVSLERYMTKASIEVEEGTEVFGSCKDISQAGALVCLPNIECNINPGNQIDHCHLDIANTLDLTCTAKVCHVTKTDTNDTLIGLSFQNIGSKQRHTMKSAINKLERLNITK